MYDALTIKFLDEIVNDAVGFAETEEESIKYATAMLNSDSPLVKKLQPGELQRVHDRIKKHYSDKRGYAIKGTARSKVKSFNWFEAEKLPEINWVCSTLGLRAGPVHILNAFSNVGKTFFAADLAACVANNTKLFDIVEMNTSGKVLHIDWDQGEEDTLIYYWKILNGRGIKSFDNLDFLFKPDWNLVSECAKEELINLTTGYTMCIIDCLGAGLPGEDLNDDRVRKYIDMLNDVSTTTKCTILLLHHEPKNTGAGKGKSKTKAIKGSGSIISSAGGSLHLTKNESSGEITLEIGKKRLTKDFTITYTLEDVGEYVPQLRNRSGIKLNASGSSLEEKAPVESMSTTVLKLIGANPEINLTSLRQNIGGDVHKIDKVIEELKQAGWIVVEGTNRKKHTITELGKKQLANDTFGPTGWNDKV